MNKNIYNQLTIRREEGRKSFAVLIDPDKISETGSLSQIINIGIENGIDYFFVGGSLLTENNLNPVLQAIKDRCSIPAVLFPGNNLQLDFSADGILLLSLISGRNADFLIGQHVVAAPLLRKSNLEILPTGYMLINQGNNTTVSYISNTTPIPADKYSVAACTAMAGEMLGLKLIYLDAGSGAKEAISPRMISEVRKSIDAPLIVGGGIRSADKAHKALKAGADVIVVGNGIESDPELIIEISAAVNSYNDSLKIH